MLTDLRFGLLTLHNPNHALRNIKVRTLRARATFYSNPQAARAGGFMILYVSFDKHFNVDRKQYNRETFARRSVAWQPASRCT